MSSSLTIEGKKYITAVLAGKQFGYTKDYLLMLAKQGKVDGQKIANRWYIDPVSAEQFFKNAKKKKIIRTEQIREERKLELKKHSEKKQTHYAKAALAETLVIVIIGLSLGATGYLGTSQQVAQAGASEYSFLENLALSVYNFLSPRSTVVVLEKTYSTSDFEGSGASTTMDDMAISAQVESITHTSLVVAPDEIFTATTIESVRDAFSDEVEVSIDPNNPDTGVIIPIFKDREGEAYRFLMVPVTEAHTQ